ncbi:hypothetical protein BD560DRAFT_395508 [Blakeslea trispora]|nr:hypothetical protein BD560DRAFT_395508 [Blakeslea trispora]
MVSHSSLQSILVQRNQFLYVLESDTFQFSYFICQSSIENLICLRCSFCFVFYLL